MATIIYKNKDELENDLLNGALHNADSGTDNQGQAILYLNIFLWNDGTFRDEPDPDFPQ